MVLKCHDDHILYKVKHGLAAVKTLTAETLEQRLLLILYNNLAHYVMDYGLGILTLSNSQGNWKGSRMKW